MAPQLSDAFSRGQIPNWQDSSTLDECAYIEDKIGGAERLARLTGSKAHTRFTGPQILRFRRTEPEAYANTSRISLVSSFLTTLLCLDGDVKGIDESDACGMNLWNMDSPSRGWTEELLNIIAGPGREAEELAAKLGKVESDGGRVVGHIGDWFVKRYGLSPACIVCPGTGDNPATFLSFTLRENEGLASLGTSDTVLVSTSVYNPDPQFHAFFHPAQIVKPSKADGQQTTATNTRQTNPMRYFNMLVYKNGSLAREFVRDKHFGGSWDRFNNAVESARPKSADDLPHKTGFWWLKPDIIPTNANGVFKFVSDRATGKSRLVDEFESSDDNAIAMLESQLLNYRSRSSAILGQVSAKTDQTTASFSSGLQRIYATGGAAANTTICSMMADVLGCDVCKPVEYDPEKEQWHNANYNACSVAAAYKAAWAWSRHAAQDEQQRFEPFDDFVKRAAQSRKSRREAAIRPAPDAQTKSKDDRVDVIEEGVAIVARPDQSRSAAYRSSVQWWEELERKALERSKALS